MRLIGLLISLQLLATATARAGDLEFSDPAHVTPPPAWAVGQADRKPDLDVLPGFQKPRPAQELKAFQNVRLQPREAKRLEIQLGPEAFHFWHPTTMKWTIEPGEFAIHIGASSRDIRLRGTVKL